MSARIDLSIEAGLATVTLHNPDKLNAINLHMWQALEHALQTLSRRDDVRCVQIRGTGQHFAAGGDIEEFRHLRTTLEQALAYHEQVARALESIFNCPHPTVAIIRGACIGGGLEIAAQCDIRLCDNTARFGAPINKLGFSMYPGEMAGLLRLAGPALVSEILLEGRILDAQEAARKGLVSRVVDTALLEQEATACTQRIMAGAPQVATWHKQSIRRLMHDQALTDAEKMAAFAFLDTQDYQEGLNAFLEKRPPRFTGH